jgi:hypothetical protein
MCTLSVPSRHDNSLECTVSKTHVYDALATRRHATQSTDGRLRLHLLLTFAGPLRQLHRVSAAPTGLLPPDADAAVA